MKNLISLLFLACALPVMAQTTNGPTTNVPPATSLFWIPGFNLDFLTNLPTASGFDTAHFGITAGVVTKDANVLNNLKGDIYIHTNWMFSAEIQNAPNLIDNASIYFGYRLTPTPNHEMYAQVLGRRTLSTDASGTPPGWQGGISVGYGFTPMSGGKLQIITEARMLTSPHGSIFSKSPPTEVMAGVKMLL